MAGDPQYRGRLAPSPTGLLHLGHARTLWTAFERAKAAGGELILRIEDLDRERSRPEFVEAIIEDLRWLGIAWTGTPVFQSQLLDLYRRALAKLKDAGRVYPCECSRKDVQAPASAPHGADDEVIYPGTCRPENRPGQASVGGNVSWRFRIPDGEAVEFIDAERGPQHFVAGRDFGDFVVWSERGGKETPAYQLAVVVDDAAMAITEVVRGADLLVSTARQLLLYRALGWRPPSFCHCPLVTDQAGRRLAKRDDAMSLRSLRAKGWPPEEALRQAVNRSRPQ